MKRLQQISTGGSSVPRRGGQPSLRGTEASTQAVIRAVYVQILGTVGYAGERNTVEEIKLENGDISLREFVRQVARSNAFRRRYWSGLYITKAIEVMHRRILGRPSFGRWEINAYFDTAARKGFYGVVDAMLESREYNECFGEDTVPYERFITPADRNARRVPALKQPFNAAAVADLTPVQRPDVTTPRPLRTVGDLVPRNLPGRPRAVRGGWSANVSGVTQGSAPAAASPTASSVPAGAAASLPHLDLDGVLQPGGKRASPCAHRGCGCRLWRWNRPLSGWRELAGRRRWGTASPRLLPSNPAMPWRGPCDRPHPRASPAVSSLNRPVQLPAVPSEEQVRGAMRNHLPATAQPGAIHRGAPAGCRIPAP